MEAFYEAAKSKLLRKDGGNHREIQCHVNDSIKMKPIREENAVRAVTNLKENDRVADSEEGTLYTNILEKLAEKLLSQYIPWVKENKRVKSLITLKDWTAGFVVQVMLYGIGKNRRYLGMQWRPKTY